LGTILEAGAIDKLSEHRCFGGRVVFYAHPSAAAGSTMRFSAFVPPQAENRPCPVLYYLAGLTCTEETFRAVVRNR